MSIPIIVVVLVLVGLFVWTCFKILKQSPVSTELEKKKAELIQKKSLVKTEKELRELEKEIEQLEKEINDENQS